MIQIEFDYNQQITVVQAKSNDLFQYVINSYLQKSLLNPNHVYFIANGNQINPQLTVERQMSDQNKQNKK